MKNTNQVRGYVSAAATAAVMLLSSAGFASAGVDFDRGVDVGSFIKEAAAAEAKAPEAKALVFTDITRDCKKVTFAPEDALTSAPVRLASRETGQDCVNYGYPVGQICTPVSRDYKAEAQITVTAPRELPPGQKEVFEVCLQGSFLSLKPVSTVYKYSVNRVLDVFQITPQGPVQTAAGVVKSAPAQETCTLAMDSDYSCVYQCGDGSFISRPNPFPAAAGWNIPFHGCRQTTPRD